MEQEVPSLGNYENRDLSITAIMEVAASSKRLFKDRYATLATEMKSKSETFILPPIGANLLQDHYSCKEEDLQNKDEKYSLNDFMNGFNDNNSGAVVDGAGNKALADQSTMAMAGD